MCLCVGFVYPISLSSACSQYTPVLRISQPVAAVPILFAKKRENWRICTIVVAVVVCRGGFVCGFFFVHNYFRAFQVLLCPRTKLDEGRGMKTKFLLGGLEQEIYPFTLFLSNISRLLIKNFPYEIRTCINRKLITQLITVFV